MTLKVGEKAEDFELETSEGDAFRLRDLENEWKIVFFYAKSGSPTCKRGCLNFKEQWASQPPPPSRGPQSPSRSRSLPPGNAGQCQVREEF